MSQNKDETITVTKGAILVGIGKPLKTNNPSAHKINSNLQSKSLDSIQDSTQQTNSQKSVLQLAEPESPL